MGKYFGTDGIRGIANEDLDSRLAYRTGLAAAMALAEESNRKPRVVIGTDTRISRDMLEAAITAGLCAAGADVTMLGIVPTPAVAFIAAESGADAGIVISASHNPYEHNGIKIFNGKGFKLSDELEAHIEELIDDNSGLELRRGDKIGRVTRRSRQHVDAYIEHVRSCAEADTGKLRAVIDCANGAAVRTAEGIFQNLLGKVSFIGNVPDGLNINDRCGSMDTKRLSTEVTQRGFDLGIAFDGDADRCIIVDERGEPVDGDKIMAACALSMKERGLLRHNAFAMTVMSNFGLHEFARNHGIELHQTKVGDRYVLERMLELDLALGGEQSGHIIFLEDSTTGDGQLAAIKFLSVLARSGKRVSELVSVVRTYPQVLLNVTISGGESVKDALGNDEILITAVREIEEKLGDSGCVLVRASGTEPLYRVMIQAQQEQIANKYASYLTEIIKVRAEAISNQEIC